MRDIKSLSEEWIVLKEEERQATERRREIEDELIKLVNHKPEGSATTKADRYAIKVTTRLNRRIDSDLLQEIAAEHGISDHLGNLFRWRPDINLTAWKSADASITTPLLNAITTTPGRPSFAINKEEA